jgi:CubicO group peptidase (beta-lactamase class C family)
MKTPLTPLLLFAALGVAACLAGEPGETGDPKVGMDRPELEKLLEEARAKHDLPMLAGAIVTDDGLRLVAAVGVRKRGATVKATDDDQVHLGSDTKPITAWLIAWLIQQGLLGWDTTLDKVFPELAKEWPETHRKLTVTELLTHHSGLPANYPGGWWSIPVKGTPREQRLVLMKKLGTIELAAKPGEKYLYSNLGYTVVGAIAERVGKASWEKLLEKQVLGPLGMKNVGHGPMGKEDAIVQPWPHSAQGKPIAPKWNADNPPVMGPAGRLHCSLPTWSKFIADLLRGSRGDKGLLEAGTYAKMFDTPYDDTFYCRGGWTGRRANAAGKGLLLTHDGSNTQNYCTAAVLPDDNLGVLVATNQGGDEARDACAYVRKALVKKWTAR